MKTLRENEKGIALLFTLGILSVLLVIALSFATSSITERKAAGNSARTTSARLLAESAINRAIAGMTYYTATYPGNNFDTAMSRDTTSPNANTADWLYRLGTSLNGATYYTCPPAPWPATIGATDPTWEYIYDGTTTNAIIGRVGYIVVPSGGKLSPSFCVSHTANFPDGGPPADEGAITEARPGKDVCEINIRNLQDSADAGLTNPTNAELTAIATALSSSAIGASGELADGTSWPDFDTMITKIGLTSPANDAIISKLAGWFIVNSTPDDEKLWGDDGDGIQESGEWYQRFNIARTDWGTFTDPTPVTNAVSAFSTTPSTHDGAGIPWIANWKENSGNWPDIATKKNQIAANIIDYCKTPAPGVAPFSTTDYAPAIPTTGSVAPAYCGLAKTPYINDVRIDIYYPGSITETFGGVTYNYTIGDLTVRSKVELINCYETDFANPLTCYVVYDIQGKLNYADANASPNTMSKNAVLQIAVPSGSVTARSLFVSANSTAVAGGGDTITGDSYDTAIQVITRDFTITRLKVWVYLLNANNKLVDYAEIDNRASFKDGAGADFTITSPSALTPHNYVQYNINDPRHNHHAADGWLASIQNAWKAADETSTIWQDAQQNAICVPNPGGNKDVEGNVNLSTGWTAAQSVSTWFIREGPMQSPWELGMIHRANAWETLNLQAYNNDDNDDGTAGQANEYGAKSTMGGSSYSKGDANILDQIKMTPSVQTYGKVNVRAPNQDSLKALLANIQYGTPQSTPGAGGTPMTYATHVTAMANSIYSARPFQTRGQLARVVKLFDGSVITQASDAQKEEIIGKFVNLAKNEAADEFTIIAIAQSIKDIGGGVTIVKDLDNAGTTAAANETTAGFDIDGDNATTTASITKTISGCAFGTYNQYADEILAEQKMMVNVKYVPSAPAGQKWVVTNLQYLDE